MMWRLLLLTALAAASDSRQSSQQPPVEEVNRAMEAAQAALASAAAERAEARRVKEAATREKRLTEAKVDKEERKIAAARASLRKKQDELSDMAESIRQAQERAKESSRKADKEKEEAVSAQAKADEKLKQTRKVHHDNVGILRDAIADDDKAAQMAEEAKKQVDEAHAEVEKVKKAEKRYEAKAKEAAAVEKVAQDAKAHADALSRQRAAELAVLQEEARARAKGKAKLLLELSKVESARRAVAAALAEAHKATRVAAQEVTDAGEKKKQAAAEMKRAKNLMQVAQEMHDVAERAMVAAHVLQSSGAKAQGQNQSQVQPPPAVREAPSKPYSPSTHGDSERAMEAAVAAAANADARLQNAEEELMKLQGIKARKEEQLRQEHRELNRATKSLDQSRATTKRDAAELSAVWDEVRILQLILGLVLAAAVAAAYYGHMRRSSLLEPKPTVVTEEKAVGKSAQSPISQSPVQRAQDYMDDPVKADTPKFSPRGTPQSPQTTPRVRPPPFGLGGAVNVPALALPAQTGPRMYYMSPRCQKDQAKESPDMSRQTSPSNDGGSPEVAETKQDRPTIPRLPALPGSSKEPLKQPLLRDP